MACDTIKIETLDADEVVSIVTQGPQGPSGSEAATLTTTGDMLYRAALANDRLPIGSEGQVLKVSSGIPAWGNESGAVTEVNGQTGAVVLDAADVGAAPATGIDPTAITGTAVVDSDARLSDSRTPLSHAHGNITNDGKVGSTAGLPLKTGTAGEVEAGAFGTGAGEFAEGNHTHELTALAATGATNGHVLTAQGDGTAAFAAASGGVSAVNSTLADILSVSGSDLVADDLGSDKLYGWDDSESKAIGFTIGSGLSVSGDTLSATATGTIGGSTGSTDNSLLRSDGAGGSTVQDSALVIDDATTSTQNNVAIVNAHSETNSALVLTPKGTGAFIVGPKPDGTATGGNARGTEAVDIQPAGRNAATQVASGNQAVAIGYRSTASGELSVSFSGTASGASSIAIRSTASGERSFAAGGLGNTAGGPRCVVIGGSFNSTGPQGSAVVVGGDNSAASGASSAVLGGRNGVASAADSVTLGGFYSRADRRGMNAQGAGQFAANGDAQRARFVLRCKTTTNAAVEMALDGSTTYLTIPSGKVIFCNIKVVGVKSDGSAVATYERQYAAKNVAGTSSEVFAEVTIGTDNAASTSLDISTVDAGDYISIKPTGIASETWRWVASVDAVEVAYGS